jgi:hypothetical protein
VPENDPSRPLGDVDIESEHADAPDEPDTQAALLRERGPGTHAEQVDDDAQLREDDTAPGVDPDESA